MIEAKTGDLLAARVDALVNAVNTVGVMGKGIALQFKRSYPAMFRAYAAACKAGELQIGSVHAFETGLAQPRWILNVPTKQHWRQASRVEYVRDGLVALRCEVEAREIESLAIPPLGCGAGGLAWSLVRPMIVDAFQDLPGVEIHLYEPFEPPGAGPTG